MTYNADLILTFADVARRHRLGGRCLIFGRQDVTVTLEHLCALLVRTGHMTGNNGVVTVPPRVAIMHQMGNHLSQKPEHRARNFVSDKLLFTALGFAGADSVDVSAFEGADFVHDLNLPGLGRSVASTYDTVLDPGTIEHVFDTATALENVFDVMHPGSVVIHNLPLGNRIDHGFYQFSPDFLLDYYEANAFEILGTTVSRFFPHPMTDMMPILDYARGCLHAKSDGGLDGGLYNVDIVARMTEQSTKGRYRSPASLARGDRPATFPASALRYLRRQQATLGLSGRCLVLGSHPQFMRAATARAVVGSVSGDGMVSERDVLTAAGFGSVVVLDSSPGPGVDVVADLNQIDTTAAREPFDFVLDWGASSRIFRVADYLRNLLAFTRVGGVVWHIAPTDNLFGRGGYQFCPTLFHDYYAANRWEILDMHLVQVEGWSDDNWFMTQYTAGTLDWLSFGGAPAGAHLVSALVRRTAESTADRVPQQSWFTRWTSTTAGQPAADAAESAAPG